MGSLCGYCRWCLLLLVGWCEGFYGVQVSEKKRVEKENYAGSKAFPASFKEKETHWPKVL